jgi:hypothetical protein
MPFRMPIEVMPICSVERSCVGSWCRRSAARFGERLQARLARHHQRDLRHGEGTVQQDKGEEDRDVHGGFPERLTSEA